MSSQSYPPPSPNAYPGARPPSGFQSSPLRRRRDTTWAWALATLVFLLLCSSAALLVLASGGQLPDLSRGESWTPPPLPTAAGDAGGQAQGGAGAGSDAQPLQPGAPVRNASGGPVNLRQTPGYQGKPTSDVVAVILPDSIGALLDGPQEADGLRWWRVRFPAGEGWMAERSSSGKVLLDLAR